MIYINQRIYEESDSISDSEILILHYIDPKLLYFVHFPDNYISVIKNIRENIDYRISPSYNKTILNIIHDVEKLKLY